MARITHSSRGTSRELASAAGNFHFVTVEAAPSKAEQLASRRQARSYAVKQALENKRKLQQEAGDNFRVATSQDVVRRNNKPKSQGAQAEVRLVPTTCSSLSPSALDPFQTLAVNSTRLQALLSTHEARCASEPVFTIAREQTRDFQNFRRVFRTGFVDPALLNAVMLSLAVAAANGRIDGECLGYRGKAISYIRERVGSRNEATTESTIGAILLLAGVEARLGVKSQVQLHLGAVRQLLDLCEKESIPLTGGIKRAVFWQDLNAAILLGSSRIVDHTTFSELRWTRDALPADFFAIPVGFQARSHLFPLELLEVLKDVRALQWVRDRPIYSRTNPFEMARINDQIASIQSRLWDEDPDLLLWLLYIGGTFAPRGSVRSSYLGLLRSNHATRFKGLYESLAESLEVLKQFIWSDVAFLSHVEAFWGEVHSPDQLKMYGIDSFGRLDDFIGH
ncbi:hypothetical protein PG996_015615 [Apiospora saccharicola]|uniref:Uncharacterized protein n=1 Tax=Apiospora saccharicola TaxID=335842 RepID=A0ABR1TLL7_9PEZI